MSGSAAVDADADPFDPRPSSLSVWLTAVAAVVGVAASAASVPATTLGLVGLVAMPLGVGRGAIGVHRLGAVALFGGVLLAGSGGASPLAMLVAAGATIVAWDVGENAIGLGRQLGADAVTRRAVLVHAAATTAVAVTVGGAGYAAYRVARAGQPTIAVAFLLAAALLFALLLD